MRLKSTKLWLPNRTGNTLLQKIEGLVQGVEFSEFPDLECGKNVVIEKLDYGVEYFCFGSDDLKKKEDKKSKISFKNGKQFLNKVGRFISSSVKDLMPVAKTTKSTNKTSEEESASDKKSKRAECVYVSTDLSKVVATFRVFLAAKDGI